MLMASLRGMLGKVGCAMLDAVLENPLVVTVALAVWMAVWIAGRAQLLNIRKRTVCLVMSVAREYAGEQRKIRLPEFYAVVYERWASSLKNWAWFIPHRLDLWPVPPTPESVRQRLGFSPDSVARLLREHQIAVEDD